MQVHNTSNLQCIEEVPSLENKCSKQVTPQRLFREAAKVESNTWKREDTFTDPKTSYAQNLIAVSLLSRDRIRGARAKPSVKGMREKSPC